jgi:hypothetical protein
LEGGPTGRLFGERNHRPSIDGHTLGRVPLWLGCLAGQAVGIKQVEDHIWLTSFMDYDLGYFDDETCRLEPLPNPFGPKVLPMSQE